MPKCSKPKVKMANKSSIKLNGKDNSKSMKGIDNTDMIVLTKLVDKLFDQIAELKATNKEYEKKINEIVAALQSAPIQDDWDVPEGTQEKIEDDLDQIMGNAS